MKSASSSAERQPGALAWTHQTRCIRASEISAGPQRKKERERESERKRGREMRKRNNIPYVMLTT